MRNSINEVQLSDTIQSADLVYENLAILIVGDDVKSCLFQNKQNSKDFIKVDINNFKKFDIIEKNQ